MTGHHLTEDKVRSSKKARVILGSLLVPLIIATIVGVALLWPGKLPADIKLPATANGASVQKATVASEVTGEEDNFTFYARLKESDELVKTSVTNDIVHAGISIGGKITVLYIPQLADELPGIEMPDYAFMDFDRTAQLVILLAVFVIAVLAVARFRGLMALLGLGVSLLIVTQFTLPGLILGKPTLAVTMVTASLVMFVVLYFTHGFSGRTTAALLGTFLGLLITAVISSWAVNNSHLVTADELLANMQYFLPGIDTKGVMICAMVLAGLGVLNDVTITQASSVWELRRANSSLSRWKVFSSAMRIGRDHIASTVYTIVFAYLGASLSMLMIIALVDQSFLSQLTSAEIASEIIRTLVSSIGLVLAIPITTALAAISLAPAREGNGEVLHVGEGDADAGYPGEAEELEIAPILQVSHGEPTERYTRPVGGEPEENHR